jgi:hypothetical protein
MKKKAVIQSVDVVTAAGIKSYYVGQTHLAGKGDVRLIHKIIAPTVSKYDCYRGLDEDGNVLFELKAVKQCNVHYFYQEEQ